MPSLHYMSSGSSSACLGCSLRCRTSSDLTECRITHLLCLFRTVLVYALPYGGPVAMVWGVSVLRSLCVTHRDDDMHVQWSLCSFFLALVAMSLAELGSAAPTSGGLYYWSFKFSSPRWRRLVSWIVGCELSSVSLLVLLTPFFLRFRFQHNRSPSRRRVHRMGMCCPTYGKS